MNFFLKYINEDKNLLKIFIFIAVFLSITKIPSIINADMQPWDEGLYATRVLSIHVNGDFWDQSNHSVGKFYSASHPPLLIWVGYIFTLIFGIHSFTLKIIPFIASLICILLLMLIGRKIDNLRTGVFAALIFSSNIIFNVFSKRFQFDIPFVMLLLTAFLLFLKYTESRKKSQLILLGVIFGLSLMVKILVGFFIPMVIFFYFVATYKKPDFNIKDFLIFVSIGIVIALPWHIYMIAVHGKEFLDYFFMYHIIDRAFVGVEQNIKSSGPLYYLNYLLSILPYGFLFFFSIFEDFKKRITLHKYDIFLYVWFLTGLLIITLFKTKLESYSLFILIPSSIIIARIILKFREYSFRTKIISSIILLFNILWVISYPDRNINFSYVLHNTDNSLIIFIFAFLISLGLLIYFSKKRNYSNLLYALIFIYFLTINIYYIFKIPEWENNYKLSECKTLIDKSGKTHIYYIGNLGTDYKYNAQFSFYFRGIDLGWKYDNYKYTFCDTKYGMDSIKKSLQEINPEESTIIIEKNNINRDDSINSSLFIPDNFKLIKKTNGYEIYQKY